MSSQLHRFVNWCPTVYRKIFHYNKRIVRYLLFRQISQARSRISHDTVNITWCAPWSSAYELMLQAESWRKGNRSSRRKGPGEPRNSSHSTNRRVRRKEVDTQLWHSDWFAPNFFLLSRLSWAWRALSRHFGSKCIRTRMAVP